MLEKHVIVAQDLLNHWLNLFRARPSETELEKRTTEAAEDERLFKVQLSNERKKFEKVIEEAVAHDLGNLKKSYAIFIQKSLFGTDELWLPMVITMKAIY